MTAQNQKNKTPLLTVIIPTYNIERYLRQCLDSVVNQTYKNLEIIIIDDNSSDSTPDIIKEYAANDARIKTVFHTKNHGPGNTRNEGLELATGDYVTFMDHDDWQDLDKYQKMMAKAAEHAADIVFCGAQEYDQLSDKTSSNYYSPPHAFIGGACHKFDRNTDRGSLYRLPYPPWAKVVSRGLLEVSMARFTENNNKFDDIQFHFLLCAFARCVVYIDEPLVTHRFFPASISGRASSRKDMFFDVIHAWSEIERACLERNHPPRELLVYYSRPLAGFMYKVKDWRAYTEKANSILDAYEMEAKDFPKEYRKFYYRIRNSSALYNCLHRFRNKLKPAYTWVGQRLGLNH